MIYDGIPEILLDQAQKPDVRMVLNFLRVVIRGI
jgi:hypothetical protein